MFSIPIIRQSLPNKKMSGHLPEGYDGRRADLSSLLKCCKIIVLSTMLKKNPYLQEFSTKSPVFLGRKIKYNEPLLGINVLLEINFYINQSLSNIQAKRIRSRKTFHSRNFLPSLHPYFLPLLPLLPKVLLTEL